MVQWIIYVKWGLCDFFVASQAIVLIQQKFKKRGFSYIKLVHLYHVERARWRVL